MSVSLLEAFLARIYVDAPARARFLRDPAGEAMRAEMDSIFLPDDTGCDQPFVLTPHQERTEGLPEELARTDERPVVERLAA